jgi:hypothetical protein
MPLQLQFRPLDSMEVTSENGPRDNDKGVKKDHRGIDLRAQSPKDLYNMHPGTVILSEFSDTLGNVIVIQDEVSGYSTLYAHLSERRVDVGDRLLGQTLIGKTGRSGPPTTQSHLHIEVINKTISDLIAGGVLLGDSRVFGKGRENPRKYLAEAFPDFPTEVIVREQGYDIEGNHRSNQMLQREKDGKPRRNIMRGLSGFDTYYTTPGDTIEDDGGRILFRVGDNNILAEGLATIIKDVNGNLIPNRWILRSSGLELGRVNNPDGTSDLRIARGGVNSLTAPDLEVLTIKDFPFAQQQQGEQQAPFGIILGKEITSFEAKTYNYPEDWIGEQTFISVPNSPEKFISLTKTNLTYPNGVVDTFSGETLAISTFNASGEIVSTQTLNNATVTFDDNGVVTSKTLSDPISNFGHTASIMPNGNIALSYAEYEMSHIFSPDSPDTPIYISKIFTSRCYN